MSPAQAPRADGLTRRLMNPIGPEQAYYDTARPAGLTEPIPPLVLGQLLLDWLRPQDRGRITPYGLGLDLLPSRPDYPADTCLQQGPVGLWFNREALSLDGAPAIPRFVVDGGPSGAEMDIRVVLPEAEKLLGVASDSKYRHRLIQVALYMLRRTEDEARVVRSLADYARLLRFTPDDAFYRFAALLQEAACHAAGIDFSWDKFLAQLEAWWEDQAPRVTSLTPSALGRWRRDQLELIKQLRGTV